MPARRPASADQSIVISSETFTLRYSMCAHVALQDYYEDATFQEVLARIGNPDQMKARDVVAFFWAGLRAHHSQLSWDDALQLIDDNGLQRTLQQVLAAFNAAMPEAEGGAGEPGDPLPPRPSTGSSKTRPASA